MLFSADATSAKNAQPGPNLKDLPEAAFNRRLKTLRMLNRVRVSCEKAPAPIFLGGMSLAIFCALLHAVPLVIGSIAFALLSSIMVPIAFSLEKRVKEPLARAEAARDWRNWYKSHPPAPPPFSTNGIAEAFHTGAARDIAVRRITLKAPGPLRKPD